MARSKVVRMFRFTLIILTLFFSGCRLNQLVQGGNGGASDDVSNPPVFESTQVVVNTSSINRNLGSGDELEFEWISEGPETQMEIQASLDGIVWHTVSAQSTQSGNFSLPVNQLTLVDGLYELRVVLTSESIDLGEILIDKTPPVLFDSQQMVTFGCFSPDDGFFQPATDNLGGEVVYEVVDVLPDSVTGCLDGTSSNECSLAPVAPYWAEVEYVAKDERGNTSEVGQLLLTFCM